MREAKSYQLSPQQQYWFSRKNTREINSNSQLVLESIAPINEEILSRAIKKVVDQESILRTHFRYIGDEKLPLQFINSTSHVDVTTHRISSIEEFKTCVQEIFLTEFNPEKGELIRYDLFDVSGKHYLVVTTSGCLLDDHSLGILAKFISNNYIAIKEGKTIDDETIIPYVQYSEWQNNINQGEDRDEGIAYWKNRTYVDGVRSFYFDKAPEDKKAIKSNTYRIDIPKDIVDRLSQSSLEPELIFGACFQIVLWKYLKQDEVFFGHVYADRDFEELHNTLGLLSKCLPLQLSFTNDLQLADLCSSYAEILEENSEYGAFYPVDATFDFDFVFEYSDTTVFQTEANSADMIFKVQERKTLIDAAKIHLRAVEDKDASQVSFHYNSTSFTAEDISLLAKAYLNILEKVLLEPEISFGEIDMFSGEETLDFFKTFNPSLQQESLEITDSAISLFKKHVQQHPSNTALTVGAKSFSYQEIDDLSDRIARSVIQVNKNKGLNIKRVAICCHENEYLISGMLGIIKAGGSYVPLDLSNPKGRTDYIIQDSGIELILTEDTLQSKFVDAQVELVNLKLLSKDTVEDFSLPEIANNNAIYTIYTSGTTGKPKGVEIAHKSLVNYVTWLEQSFDINHHDSAVLISSFAFDLGYTALWGTILNGGNLHLVPSADYKNPDGIIDYIVSSNISFIKTTPSLFSLMIKSDNLHKISKSNLRLVFIGGEPIRVSDLKLFSNNNPNIQLVNHYGPTESTIGVVTKTIDNTYLDNLGTIPSIGFPILNVNAIILDESNKIVPPGIPGELCISGASLAIGYVDKEELTGLKFIPHPYIKNAKMYRSGDIAFWNTNGEICLLGRKDNQVKIRGYRVDLGEIQSHITGHPKISEAIVTTINVADDSKELAAYYVSDGQVSKKELREFLGDLFLEAMIPSYWIALEEIPLDANGKVNLKELPEPSMYVTSDRKVSPKNEYQKRLADIWAELLGISNPGIQDSFFDLGGHSLNAIQMTLKIQKEFQIKVDLETVFSNPTIEELSKVLSSQMQEKVEKIPILQPKEFYDLSRAQMRIWVASKFEGGGKAYNIPSVYCLEGNLREDYLEDAFHTLICKNESLRTVFVEEKEIPKQKIIPAADFDFKLDKLDYRKKAHKDQLIREFVEKDVGKAFDFEIGPLLRATLIQIEDEKYVVVFNIHHIISDGWSRGLFFGLLIASYKNRMDAIEESLAPSPIQYKEYAAWHSNTFELQYKFWAELYGDDIPTSKFPTDFPRPKILSFSEATVRKTIAPELLQILTSSSKNLGITLNNLMLSLYGLLVGRYSGEQEVVIGSLVSGRNHLEIEKLLGVFINFLPIKLRFSEEQSITSYLEESNETLVKAYDNQDYPFDLMVDKFIKERDLSHNPFFDTMVNFHWEGDINLIKDSVDIESLGIAIVDHDYGISDLGNSGLDCKLDIRPQADALELYLSYNTHLFQEGTMELFLDRFVQLLQEFGNNSENNIGAYVNDIVPDSEPEKDAVLFPVNLCGSFVLEPMKEVLAYWSNEFEMNLQLNFAPYNQVFQQLLNPDSILHTNNGINVLFIRVEDWIRDFKEGAESEKTTFLDNTFQELIAAFTQSRSFAFKPYIIGMVPISDAYEVENDLSKTLHETNQKLVDFFTKSAGCYLLNIEEAIALYEVAELFDPKTDAVAHMPFSSDAYAAIATFLGRKIRTFQDDPYKVIAVDCDNTLWGGICGEDGASGIVIDEHYQAVQQFLIDKYNEGFLIVLCSKNNEQDVWEVFDTRPEMKLKTHHIVGHRINWIPKLENIIALSKELNVGTDSFIFIDDSRFEIEQMMSGCEEVLSLLMPENQQEFEGYLRNNWAFDKLTITQEDANRNAMYKAEKERTKAKFDANELMSDFIDSLHIEVEIEDLTELNIERVAQLTQRTNQFNLNGIRKNEGEIVTYSQKTTTINWAIRVKDKFGDYGLVGVVLADIKYKTLHIDTFLLSCRVLGRNVEHSIAQQIEAYCKNNNIASIALHYIKTSKNKPFEDFLTSMDWEINHEVVDSEMGLLNP